MKCLPWRDAATPGKTTLVLGLSPSSGFLGDAIDAAVETVLPIAHLDEIAAMMLGL
jgi:hypothetical protein